MRIINQTKNSVLAQNAGLADTPFGRIRGLLGRKELKSGEALIIKPGNSVHTFFMRFAIDVLFLDKNNRVIKALPALKPFRLSPLCFKAYLTIELAEGVISTSHTEPGDIINII